MEYKKTEVKPIMVDVLCDGCKVPMVYKGIKPDYNPLNMGDIKIRRHECPTCGKVMDLDTAYPTIQYEPVNNY